jgi:hypothetical protein
LLPWSYSGSTTKPAPANAVKNPPFQPSSYGASGIRKIHETADLYSKPFMPYYPIVMTAIAEQLDHKLVSWKPETAAQVEKLVADIIDWTDSDALDLIHTRELEQEVLDLLDEN